MKHPMKDSSIEWEFNPDDGTLKISGTGKMPGFNQDTETENFIDNPWSQIKEQIKTIIVDKGVTSISGAAFWKCLNLEKAFLPHVVQISAGAFYECGSLKEAFIAEVTTIGEGAFENCFSLTRVAPDATSSAKRIIESLLFVDECAFANCKKLESVTFSNLKALGRGAFFQCASLRTVSCERLSLIGEHAFRDCCALKECRVHQGCMIADSAFEKACIAAPTKYVERA